VAKRSSQHDKCQFRYMLWTKGSSKTNRFQVGNMQSNYLDLVHSKVKRIERSLTITRMGVD
jgi:hypothetical protein